MEDIIKKLEHFDNNVLQQALESSMGATAESEGYLKLSDSITDFIMSSSLSKFLKAHLQSVKIYHLLNHSNGFDHSILEALPKKSSGMIDTEALLSSFENVGVISSPELIFNYNSIGPWLAAAILEHVYKKPYS